MKNPHSISKTSNISSILATVLVWVLVFLLFWNKTFTGAGLTLNENVLSLNMELVRGEEGQNTNTKEIQQEKIENHETTPAQKIESTPQIEPAPKSDPAPPIQPAPQIEQPPKTEPVPQIEPSPKPEVKQDNLPKTEPSPQKEWKLAKSVDDSLGDLWSYDFENVTESTEGIFDEDYSSKSGSHNAQINESNGSSNAASGNNGNGLEIRLKDVKERILLEPSEPVITLSRNSSTLLTESIKVHLVCKILKSGTVTEVSFNPANVLPNSVMREIKESLLTWKFNEADSQTVTFELEIAP